MNSQNFRKMVYLSVFMAFIVAFTGTQVIAAMETVNINTASVEELMKLDRVGKSYAQKIVEYREKIGPFKKPEDIMNVKGIGQKTWEANKDRIEV